MHQYCGDLGPVVQSVVSLTSSLRVISLTVLAIYNMLIFFTEKMWVAFALLKLLTFFQQKISAYLRITPCNFNESLTNDIVGFEQLGPGLGLQMGKYCQFLTQLYVHHTIVAGYYHFSFLFSSFRLFSLAVVWGGWVWRRCLVSYISGAFNWYRLTVRQGLLSL